MDAEGLEVRPIINIAGIHHFNQLFFTDVRIPIENRLGAEGDFEAVRAVAEQIAKKIRYGDRIPHGKERAFLLAFYAAQRARLEQRRLLGRRKADKYGDKVKRRP